MSGYILVMIVGAAISGIAALWVRSSYSKYSKKMSTSGLAGARSWTVAASQTSASSLCQDS